MTRYAQPRGPQVGQHIGDYELVSHLARGDLGEVFLAHHPKSGRQLAIKVLDADLCADPQLLQYYEHEVWTVNHLGHPNIVEVLDFGKLDGGRAFLVMKLLRGRSLAELLAEHGRFSAARARELLLPALEALTAVHGAGITHKDLKPSNVFLEDRPGGGVEPQLLDIGLAHLRPLAAVPGSAGQLASSALPLYNPPEQVTGDLQAVGPWSDIYAAGANLFHLLGGRPPYIGATAREVAEQHLHAPPPDLAALRPEVHPTLAKVIQQALAKRPAERFESMRAFLKAFQSASSRPAPTLRGPTAAPEPAPPPVAVMAVAPPPVTVMAAAAPGPWPDRTPPPTLRIDAVQVPPYVGAVAQQPFQQPAQRPFQQPAQRPPPPGPWPGPPGPGAPMPGMPGATAGARPGASHLSAGLWAVFILFGLLLASGVVAGLVIALGGDDKAKETPGKPAKEAARPVPPQARPVTAARVTPPVVPPPGVTRAVPAVPLPILPRVERYRVDIRNRPWKGAEHARATVVLYCGFAGYYCRSTRDNFRRIVSDYPQDVKLVWMDYPLHYYKRSMPAAVAAAEVFVQRGRAGFWKMHDQLYGNPYQHTDDNLVRWALEAGADSAKVRAAVTSLSHQTAIRALMAKASDLGVSYTPTVFVNGVRLSDAKSYDTLKARVEAEIALAKQTIGTAGVTLQGYYAHVQKNALAKRSRGLGLYPRPYKPYKPTPPATPYTPTLPYKPYKPYGSLNSSVYYVPVTAKSPQQGPANALVTVVLFGDFQCPFTFRLQCALRVALKKYPRDVRLVWMNNPLSYHRLALSAAEAALEAFAQKGSRGFWALHDRLFPMDLCKPDGGWRFGFFGRRDKLSETDLVARAQALRLNLGRFRRALRGRTHQKQVLAEQRLAKGHFASSTPTMFVNGKRHFGAKTVADLKTLLDEARTDALKTLRVKRVTRAKLYDAIIATGRKPYGWP